MLHRREHSFCELQEKLKQRGYLEDEISQVLCECQRLNYQSDERFTSMFIRNEYRKGYGFQRVKMKLKQLHQIPISLIDQVYQELELDWFELLTRVLQKKFPQLDRKSQRDYQKAYQFLQYRGFCSDEIREVLS